MDRIINVNVGGNYVTKDGKIAGVRGEANITKLRITFDEGWDGYAKEIVFWDSHGQNPVKVVITAYMLENVLNSERIYLVPIPGEPLAEAGMMTFVIEGYLGGVIQRSVSDKLEVKYSPVAQNASNAIEPTPTDLQQMQTQIDGLTDEIKRAVEAKEDIENMSVSSESLPSGASAFVEKSENNGVVNLNFGLPAGERGESGVYIGDTEPIDDDVTVWIDTSGEPTGTEGFYKLSIRAFGAKGDGITDDTEALRAASRCGEAVFFPEGTYLLFGQIDMSEDINWRGEGAKSIIKLMPYEQNGDTSYNCDMINHASANRYSISLQDLVLDANEYIKDICLNNASGHYHTACLNLDGPSSVYLSNVEMKNALTDGCHIVATDESKIRISNCSFNDNCVNGLRLEGDGRNAFICDCEFNNNIRVGLMLDGASNTNISNISCDAKSTYYYCGVGLFRGATLNTLSGVYCRGCGIVLRTTVNYDSLDGEYDSTLPFPNKNTFCAVTIDGLNGATGIEFGNCDNTVITGYNYFNNGYACSAMYTTTDKPVHVCLMGYNFNDSYSVLDMNYIPEKYMSLLKVKASGFPDFNW